MNQIREDFPILRELVHAKPLCYLDNASSTQKPAMVLQAMDDFYQHYYATVHRSIYTFGEHATEAYEAARAKIASFFHVDTDEIIFTKGTTEGINAIVATWGNEYIKSGDRIVLSELEHHANLLPWQRLAKQKNAEIVYIPITNDGQLDLTSLDHYINARTKIVSITHCSNVIGTLVDLDPIIQAAKAIGAKIMIDGAQSAPHERINLRALDVDFFVCSGHKMLGPTGIGVLYVNKHLHDALPPYQVGGGMVQTVSFSEEPLYRPMPYRFEAGTPPIAEAIGLGAAIDYLEKYIDFVALKKHEAALSTRLITGLQQYSQVRIFGPLEKLKQQSSIVSFVVDDMHPHDVAAFLDQYGIAVRAGNHCAQPLLQRLGVNASVRVSVYCYNTIGEIDRLLSAMDELLDA